MDGMLSQEEINALLGGASNDSSTESNGATLEDEEKDAIGEISNICMGTAATTLYSLVNQKVLITTPVVKINNWENLTSNYEKPCVFINIFYREGIDGNNVLILKEDDVKIITDLMMGGDGLNPSDELSELHFSAICEAMNQMMGSASTSLSSMLNRKIDISPPEADLVDMAGDIDSSKVDAFLANDFVEVTFRMTIGDLVDSTIMQLYPIHLAKELYTIFTADASDGAKAEAPQAAPAPSAPTPPPQPQPAMAQPQMQGMSQQAMPQQPMMGMPMMGAPMMGVPMMPQQDVNVQNVQFQAFNSFVNPALQQENIDLIMDVPLEVSVVLGRTRKSIKEILEFSPGTIIELDKLAGEAIDVMVNQKLVAKGEVVVIEESFGIRITEIIKEKM